MRNSPHSPRSEQRGDGWVGTAIWGLVGFAIFFIGYKMLKPQYQKYYLEQKVEQVIHYSGNPEAGKLQDEILVYAEREGIPLDPKDIVVTKKPAGGAIIVIEYDTEVDFVITKYKVHTRIENNSNQY